MSVHRAEDVAPDRLADWLARGSVVVVPTETVYGLAASPRSPEAVARVFELKGRPVQMNLPILVGSIDQVKALGVDFPPTAQALAATFWPGPLTIVMGFGPAVRPDWLHGRDEVAIRLPDFPLLQRAAEFGGPILLTSANGHGLGPQRTVDAAVNSLHGAPDYVIDAGTLLDTPSTIVNVRKHPATIERRGAVTAADLAAFIDAGDVAEESTWPR